MFTTYISVHSQTSLYVAFEYSIASEDVSNCDLMIDCLIEYVLPDQI